MTAAHPRVARARVGRRRPHPGESHEWSLPLPQLAGARACRNCGELYPGSSARPGPSPATRGAESEAQLVAEPYRACPRYETCSVNACPFDPEIKLRASDPGDRELRCPLGKKARRSIFSSLPPAARARLPFEGLHEAEFKRREAARRQAATLSPEARAKMLERLRRTQFRPRTPRPETPSTTDAASGPLPRQAPPKHAETEEAPA
jgi:hypothetical protein